MLSRKAASLGSEQEAAAVDCGVRGEEAAAAGKSGRFLLPTIALMNVTSDGSKALPSLRKIS